MRHKIKKKIEIEIGTTRQDAKTDYYRSKIFSALMSVLYGNGLIWLI